MNLTFKTMDGGDDFLLPRHGLKIILMYQVHRIFNDFYNFRWLLLCTFALLVVDTPVLPYQTLQEN